MKESFEEIKNTETLEDEPIVPRKENEKDLLLNRLKRIEGQVRGLQKMVEDDRYCVDVLVQISAVSAALDKVGYTMMERHAKMCVTEAVKQGDGDAHMDELMKVIRQFSK